MEKSILAFRYLGAFTALCSLFLLFTSCGLQPSGGSASFSIDPYTTPDSSGFTASGREIVTGTGNLVFDTLIGSTTGSKSFRFKFQLTEPNSIVELWAHADKNLSEGYKIVFERSSLNFVAKIFRDNQEITTLSSQLTALNAELATEFVIEIDNSGSSSRWYLWNPDISSDFTSATALYDSSNDSNTIALSTGFYWGITLKSAELSKALLQTSVLQ